MKKSIIYWAQCKIKPDLIYIGKTHQKSLNDRIEQHITSAKNGSSTPFHQALLNYGLINWKWDILIECTVDDEIEKEKELIKKYNALPIDLLNVSNASKKKSKKKKIIPSSIRSRIKGNKYIKRDKSELGKLFLRSSGKIKPVINLKTQTTYQSTLEASRKENISISILRKCCSTGQMLENGTRYAYLNLEDQPILNDGHSKDHYINQRKGRIMRKVKNLVNGKIYKNIKEVMKEYNVSNSSADGAARGTYMVLKNNWVICYIDEFGNEIITKNHRRGIKKLKDRDQIKYMAWHVDDEKIEKPLYFKNIDELCNKLQINGKSHVKSVCDGKRAHVEKWRIAYFDFENEKPVLTEKHLVKPRKVLRRIICLNDKREFESGIEAGRYYNLISSQITKCAKGESKSVYGKDERLRFAFLDDDGNPILTNKHSESLSHRGKKRILLLKTGEKYNSLAEFIRVTGIPYKTAKRYLKNQDIDLFGYEFIEID